MFIEGFPPLASPRAHTLILGSMPSASSLDAGCYYAHPQNSFWPIMRVLLAIESDDYPAMVLALERHGLAVWDVLKRCRRASSMDADIEEDSIEVNDFPAFFQSHRAIARIFFNGAKAEQVFSRRVLPLLPPKVQRLPRGRLPSTSPAYAAMSFEEKKKAWRAVAHDPRP